MEYRQIKANQPESGGAIIGQYLASDGFLLINDFTPPQETDNQTRFSCYRSEQHNLLANQIWKNSNRKSTFVGLWHTHPEPIPNYSRVDRRDWNNTLNEASYYGEYLVFIIVGQTHLKCWLGSKHWLRNKIELLGTQELGE